MKFKELLNYRFDLQHVWVITIVMGVFIFVNTQPIRPHDFWWHLALGREVATTLTIPGVDVYSFTMAGAPYPSYQMFWLFDLVLYGIYQLGGPGLVVFFQSLVITAAYGLLLWLCWKQSNSTRIAAFSILLAITLGINNWNVRPQTISFLIGVLFLISIYSYRRTSRKILLLILPLGMLVWVNSHGSFVIGLVLIGIWVGDEVWQVAVDHYRKIEKSYSRLWVSLLSLGITALICFVNPRGFGIVKYVLTLTGDVTVQNLVPEWAPPSFDDIYGIIFYAVLMLSAVALAVSPKRPEFLQLSTFVTFGILALSTIRGIVWFGIVMAPILAHHLSEVVITFRHALDGDKTRIGKPFLNWLFIAIILAAAIISLPWLKHYLPFPRSKSGLISSETPVEATEFLLDEQSPGELFNEMGFGSYLIWAAFPQYRVFVDTRIELYPLDLWWDYSTIGNALPGWETLLDEHEIHTLMLSPMTQQPLVDAAGKSSVWFKVFEDQSAVIFVRNTEE